MGSFADQKLARTERRKGWEGRKSKEAAVDLSRYQIYIYIWIYVYIYISVSLVKNDRSFESVVARTPLSPPARILRIVSIYNGGGI